MAEASETRKVASVSKMTLKENGQNLVSHCKDGDERGWSKKTERVEWESGREKGRWEVENSGNGC